MAARDGKSFDMLTGHSLPALMQRAYLDRDFAEALTGKMWMPAANDGRKLKIATLYGYIRDHGDRKTDVLGRAIQPDRAWAEWQHRQQLATFLQQAFTL